MIKVISHVNRYLFLYFTMWITILYSWNYS